MKKILCAFALFVSTFGFSDVDLNAIEQDLAGNGVRGWIHGAAHDLKQYVFFYRDPNDFFTHAAFTLVPQNPNLLAQLKAVQRHDEVIIHGSYLKNPSPQKHIRLTKLQVVKSFDPGIKVSPHKRQAVLPKELEGGTEFLATVHAVEGEGAVLVFEYKDAIVPMFAKDTTHTKDLFRGDKVRVHYVIQKSPNLPPHVLFDPKANPPIEVIEKISDGHGKPTTLEGTLVFFPKSPQILFGVYALQVVDANGLKLNHTLVNFDDPAVFTEIRRKLEKLWDAQKATIEDGRNCFINPQIRIRATGIKNVTSPSQANPQILLDGPDAIELVGPASP